MPIHSFVHWAGCVFMRALLKHVNFLFLLYYLTHLDIVSLLHLCNIHTYVAEAHNLHFCLSGGLFPKMATRQHRLSGSHSTNRKASSSRTNTPLITSMGSPAPSSPDDDVRIPFYWMVEVLTYRFVEGLGPLHIALSSD